MRTAPVIPRKVTPFAGVTFLGITGAVLIWDLEHPARFFYIFTRPQWRSWLVRGGGIIAGYGAILTLHLVASLIDAGGLSVALTVAGIPLSLMTAVYTAFLFAQAKGRDLWQNPLLPPHFAVQSVLAGAAFLALFSPAFSDEAGEALGWTMAGAAIFHLLMVLGELTLPHGTAHAHLAVHNLTHGHLGRFFWLGVALVALAVAGPLVGVVAGVVALAGLLAHEHAYVQAAQSVPLA